MIEPLTGYPLPDSAYTDHDEHFCILPALFVMPDWQNPTRKWGALPIGTRWRCGHCETVHEVVAASLGRVWQLVEINLQEEIDYERRQEES